MSDYNPKELRAAIKLVREKLASARAQMRELKKRQHSKTSQALLAEDIDIYVNEIDRLNYLLKEKAKNPVGRYRLYSRENKKYAPGTFQGIDIARDVAKTIYNLTGHVIEIRDGSKTVDVIGSVAKAGKNPVMRKRNPTNQQLARAEKAMKLFKRFRLQEPEFVDEISIEFHDVLMEIGKCDAVEYETRRNGKAEFYRHEFTGKSRPILASSWDGKQLYFVKGHYNFTQDGIVDYNPKTGKEIRD